MSPPGVRSLAVERTSPPTHMLPMKSRILLLTITSTGMASAFTSVQTKTFAYVPASSADLVFDRFDPSLGTLTSIMVTTTVHKTNGSLYIDNDTASSVTGNITQDVTITLGSTDVDLLALGGGGIGVNVAAISSYAAVTAIDDGDGAGFQTGGTDCDGTSFGPTTAAITQYVKSLVWSSYMGAGTYIITASASQGYSDAAFGDAALSLTPATASGDVTITYSYVPEPAAAWLGGLGFLTLLRRRR